MHPAPAGRVAYARGVPDRRAAAASPGQASPGRASPGQAATTSDPAVGTRLRISRTLSIPMSEVAWRATTSGGPGGQHANRASSRVEVRFDVLRSATLGPRQRARLLERAGPVVRATSTDDRSQARNRQIALDRLAERIAAALRTEAPRRPTAPTKGSKERRLQDKRRRSEVKRHRGGAVDPDG